MERNEKKDKVQVSARQVKEVIMENSNFKTKVIALCKNVDKVRDEAFMEL